MTGFNLPPGVSLRDIDPPEHPCECCGHMVDSCICPACTVCGGHGDPRCYAATSEGDAHGMEYSKAQLIGRARLRIAMLKDQIAEEEQMMEQLEHEICAETPAFWDASNEKIHFVSDSLKRKIKRIAARQKRR